MMHYHCAGGVAAAVCLATVLNAAQEVRKFEFVSVRSSPAPTATRPGAPAPGGEFSVLPDGRLEVRGETLANLARVAFGVEGVDPRQGVVKAPDWTWKDRFDVTASTGQPWSTPPSGTKVPVELRTMLRALLADRFALQARIAMKNVDIYGVRLAKPDTLGPGLRRSTAECRGPFTDASPAEAAPRPRCPFTNQPNEIQAQAVTMPEVAQILSQHAKFQGGPLLVDQTGLPGRYDLSYSAKRGDASTLVGMFEVQLGLTLRATSIPLPTLIIESAKKPQEN